MRVTVNKKMADIHVGPSCLRAALNGMILHFWKCLSPWILRQPGFAFVGSRYLKTTALLPHSFPITPPTRGGPAEDGRDVKILCQETACLSEHRPLLHFPFIFYVVNADKARALVKFSYCSLDKWLTEECIWRLKAMEIESKAFSRQKRSTHFCFGCLMCPFSQPWRPSQPWGPASS